MDVAVGGGLDVLRKAEEVVADPPVVVECTILQQLGELVDLREGVQRKVGRESIAGQDDRTPPFWLRADGRGSTEHRRRNGGKMMEAVKGGGLVLACAGLCRNVCSYIKGWGELLRGMYP